MITKQDIKKLQEHQGYPSISIFVQTHKTMPDRLQDPIRVKDLVKEAIQKLSSEFTKDEVTELVKSLNNLAEKIDYRNLLDGLALFISPNFAQSYVLPFSVQDKVVIDKIFAVKELVKGLSITFTYWVLSLSHKPARLFKGQGDHLVEVIDEPEMVQNMLGFPFRLNYDVTSDSAKQAYSVGDLGSDYVSRQLDHFMHQLDDLLLKKLAHENLPLIIIGTIKNRADFEKITRFKKDIIAQIEGDCTHLSVQEIEKIVKKHLDHYVDMQETTTVAYLNEAVGKEHYVMGVKDVWKQAQAGKVRTLIIEENYNIPAYIDSKNPNEVIIYDKSNIPGGYKNLTDDIVSHVFHSKGKVLFVKDGSLANFERIAAILWY